MKKYIILGGLGFIGSHLTDALLDDPETGIVTVIDDLSSGRRENLAHRSADVESGRLVIVEKDFNVADFPMTKNHFRMDGDEVVFNMAANPDARKGIADTWLDIRLETILTYKLLEAMRLNGVKKIILASSGTVYGNQNLEVCREGFGERLPISLYGAGKLASEGLVSAFCGTFGMKAVIFRFGNVCGERAGHGCIYDFINQLREHPDHLNVLGDGNQSKPYIYVKEIVAGMIHGLGLLDKRSAYLCEPFKSDPSYGVDAFNLAPDGATSVRFIAEELANAMAEYNGPENTFRAVIKYGSTPAGWAGDVPHSRMSMAKLEATGFRLQRSSDEAVKYAISEILKTL